MRNFRSAPRSRIHSGKLYVQHHATDFLLFACVVVLTIFGLVMVYDASVAQAYQNFGDKYFFIKQQLMWVVLGFLSLAFFAFFNFRYLKLYATPAFLVSLFLLLLVFIPGLGVNAGGAHRWLRILGFTIQPTELIKLSSVIFFAAMFDKKIQLTPFLIITGFVVLIVGLFQRDLGSAIVFSMTGLGMLFVSGASINYFISLIPLSVIGGVLFTLTSSYRKQRVMAFLDPFTDPQGFSYHISQVLIALGSGGIFGLGLGQSRQKYNFIPEVTTDSIFSIVGEELGFVGCVVLILLLGFLIYRGFKIATNCTDNFGKLLAAGLTIWLATQACVNLAAMVSLIPLTGVPLPFISYGGSALLGNLTAVGILLNISRSSKL